MIGSILFLSCLISTAIWEMPVMKVDFVSECKNIVHYCTGNGWKKFLIEKLENEI